MRGTSYAMLCVTNLGPDFVYNAAKTPERELDGQGYLFMNQQKHTHEKQGLSRLPRLLETPLLL